MSRKRNIAQFEQIRNWAKARGLYAFGDVKTQTIKLNEEVGEINRAVLKIDAEGIKDGIGDAMVVLINLAEIAGFRAEECLQQAWQEIENRKGRMNNGTFQKES